MRKMAEGPKPDMVNKPPHYQSAEVECIDAIKAATGGLRLPHYKARC